MSPRKVSRDVALQRRLAWSLLLLSVSVAWSAEPPTPARERTVAFALPPQPLADALAAFSALTGYSVLVAGELTANRRAAPVYGEYAPRRALQHLLADTGLTVRYSGGNAFSLVPAAPEAVPAPAPVVSWQVPAFAGVLQVSVTRALCAAQGEAFGRYRVGLQLWIDEDGRVSEVRLLGTSGTGWRDAELQRVLLGLVLDDSPPPGLPQPVTLLLAPVADPAGDCRRLGAGAD